MRRILVAALASVLGAANPATAQDTWSWSVLVPAWTGTNTLGTVLNNGGAQSAAGRQAAPAASLIFTPSAERRKTNFSRFIQQRRGGDAASLRQLEQILGDPQLMPRMDQELRRHGLRGDNVADAYAAWWITSWQATRGQTEDPPKPAVLAVKAQVERALLAGGAVARADDASKQMLAEELLLQTLLLGSILEQVKSNPAQLRQIGEQARRNARQFGLDLDAMILTDQGFRPVRG